MPNYAYIDTTAHPAALSYYNTFRSEPTGPSHNMTSITAVAMPNMMLDSLLDSIILQRPEGVLIVSHGREGGLSVRFDSQNNQIRANHIALGVLSATSSTTVMGATVPAVSDAAAAQQLGVSEATVTRLRAKMRQVQNIHIQHLALRACNTGRYSDLLQITQRFFNATTASAPSAQDCYAIFNPGHPTTNQRVWDRWTATHPGYWIEGANPDRVAYQIQIDNTHHTFRYAFIAGSYGAVSNWISAQLPNTATPNPRSAFPIHAIRDDRGGQFPPFAFPNTLRYRQLITRNE